MSGGSYDYAYSRLDEFANQLRINGDCSAAPPALRLAFVEHCRKVARAMHAIEWNDSCDGDDDETRLISDILSSQDVVDAATGQLERAIVEAKDALRVIESMGNR